MAEKALKGKRIHSHGCQILLGVTYSALDQQQKVLGDDVGICEIKNKRIANRR